MRERSTGLPLSLKGADDAWVIQAEALLGRNQHFCIASVFFIWCSRETSSGSTRKQCNKAKNTLFNMYDDAYKECIYAGQGPPCTVRCDVCVLLEGAPQCPVG